MRRSSLFVGADGRVGGHMDPYGPTSMLCASGVAPDGAAAEALAAHAPPGSAGGAAMAAEGALLPLQAGVSADAAGRGPPTMTTLSGARAGSCFTRSVVHSRPLSSRAGSAGSSARLTAVAQAQARSQAQAQASGAVAPPCSPPNVYEAGPRERAVATGEAANALLFPPRSPRPTTSSGVGRRHGGREGGEGAMMALGGSATCFARPATAPAAGRAGCGAADDSSSSHDRRNSTCLAGPATAAAVASATAARVGVVTADGESPVAVAPFSAAPPSTMALSPRQRPRLSLTPRQHVQRLQEHSVLQAAATAASAASAAPSSARGRSNGEGAATSSRFGLRPPSVAAQGGWGAPAAAAVAAAAGGDNGAATAAAAAAAAARLSLTSHPGRQPASARPHSGGSGGGSSGGGGSAHPPPPSVDHYLVLPPSKSARAFVSHEAAGGAVAAAAAAAKVRWRVSLESVWRARTAGVMADGLLEAGLTLSSGASPPAEPPPWPTTASQAPPRPPASPRAHAIARSFQPLLHGPASARLAGGGLLDAPAWHSVRPNRRTAADARLLQGAIRRHQVQWAANDWKPQPPPVPPLSATDGAPGSPDGAAVARAAYESAVAEREAAARGAAALDSARAFLSGEQIQFGRPARAAG